MKVEFDYTKFLAQDGEEVVFLKEHQETFGHRDNYLNITIVNEPTVFDTAFLKKVERFTKACDQLENVDEVISLPTLRTYVRTVFFWVRQSVLTYHTDSLLQESRSKILENENLVNNLVSADETVLNVLLEVSRSLDLDEKAAFIASVDSLMLVFDFPETHLAGLTNTEIRFSELVMRELPVFLGSCILLIIITLGFIYRSFWGVLLPLLVFLFTIIILGGIFVLTDRHINPLTNSLFSITLIVGVSDVIHIFSKFQSEGDCEHAKADLGAVIFNNFLTSLTTFIGFFTFYWTPMEAMEKYGVEAALCVLLAYVISIFFVPAVLFCLKPSQLPTVSVGAKRLWKIFYSIIQKINGLALYSGSASLSAGEVEGLENVQSLEWSRRHRNSVFLWIAVVLVLSVIGIFRIEDNPTLVSSMPFDHPVRQDIRFLESKNLGSRYFELAIKAKEGKLTTLENLKAIEAIQDSLLKTEEICSVISPVSYYKSGNEARFPLSENGYRLPADQAEIQYIDQFLPKSFRNVFREVLDSTQTRGVILGKMKDAGKNDIQRFNHELMQWISVRADTSNLSVRLTGTALLLDKINDIQIKAAFQGLTVAVLVIAFIMAILFRSVRFVFITLVINCIPLVLMAGVMGFGGIEMRAGTSIVFTIAFVIAVDDTIHLLSNYAYQLRSGAGPETALVRTMEQIGQAIFFTSLVIFLSFSVLLFSSFDDISALGFLTSITIVFALIGDLGILPWLLLR